MVSHFNPHNKPLKACALLYDADGLEIIKALTYLATYIKVTLNKGLPMAKKWSGLEKLAEEMNELGVELMKLRVFPTGKHPGRKRNLRLYVQEECADVAAALDYFIDRNGLDREQIMKRKAVKTKKFKSWWGDIKPIKSKTSKKSPKAKRPVSNVSLHVETSSNAPKTRLGRPRIAEKRRENVKLTQT